MPYRTFVAEIAYIVLFGPYEPILFIRNGTKKIWHQKCLSQSEQAEKDVEMILVLLPKPFAHVPWPQSK